MEQSLIALLVQLAAAFVVFFAIWTHLNSTLKHVPGPFLAKYTDLWRFLSVWRGRAHETQRRLHDRHGAAVRLGPNMISISDPGMIGEIYSRKRVLPKVRSLPYKPSPNAPSDPSRRASSTPSATSTRADAACPPSSARATRPSMRPP